MTNPNENENILDEPVPDVYVEVLTPQQAPSYFQSLRKYASDKAESMKKEWNRWFDWLVNYIPPIPKVIDKAFEVVKKYIEIL